MKKLKGIFGYSFDDRWLFVSRNGGAPKLRKTPVFIRTFLEPKGPDWPVAGQVCRAPRGIRR
jgi:hypothetical protein